MFHFIFLKLSPDIGFYETFNVHAYFDSVFLKLSISSYFTDNDQHLPSQIEPVA